MLQQEADANGLVWENGVPFRKDLLELARKRQSGEFSIAPLVFVQFLIKAFEDETYLISVHTRKGCIRKSKDSPTA